MSPNSGILLNGVLRHRLLNKSLDSCSFKNRDFLLPHAANFYSNIVLPFFVFITFELRRLSIFFAF